MNPMRGDRRPWAHEPDRRGRSTTTGVTTTLTTHDTAFMTVSYATTPFPGSQQHAGTEVRIAAGGPHAANMLGVTD